MRISAAILHCLSNFSFLRGAANADALVRCAAERGYAAIAITDECSMAGAVRMHDAAKEYGIRLLLGAEFAVEDAPAARLVLLARHREGYGDLCELITLARSRKPKGEYQLFVADLAKVRGCCAIVIPDVLHADASHDVRALMQHFPFTNHGISCWLGAALNYEADDAHAQTLLSAMGDEIGLPVVACDCVLYADREHKPLQDVMTAIRLHRPVAELGLALNAHAENYLKPIDHLLRRYPAAWVANTLMVAAQCRFDLQELRYEYPREIVPEGETPAVYLRRIAYEGGRERYGDAIPEKVQCALEHELGIIGELEYEAFFLTIYDIVKFARGQGILCQGRGSAANSAVCYCLGITEVNPEIHQLLFERFLSRERKQPPDIDVDFEHERREEVIQYIYGKYGRERTALAAAVSVYRAKGALRDAGKALGLSLSQVDALAKTITWWDGRTIAPARLIEAGFDPEAPRMKMVMLMTEALIGHPRHLSQHSGGFVIARDKLTRLVPVEKAAMAGRSVIQWDKDDLESLGLLKVDVLALGMLSAIRGTLELLHRWRGKPKTMQDLPPDDEKTYEMIQRADTIGVFQIESRAQMSMLPRLKPKEFYDLVVEVAIVRPGPIQGGMVHPYLRRRDGEEEVTYPIPAIKNILKRTLGVPIFQEQVMQIAIDAAGFTPDEADKLRRAMAAWKRGGDVSQFKEKLINGLQASGCTRDFAERLFKQMEGFGEYGFPESHAASFAWLVYVSCYLKCHYPAAFTCGLLNAQPLGFYSPAQLVQDAQRHGVTVMPVDVTISGKQSMLEGEDKESPAIRLGLDRIGGLSAEAVQRIVEARAARPFDDVDDLKRRAALARREIEALAAGDALASLAGHRRGALWKALGLERDTALFHAPIDDAAPMLLPPTEADDVFADYATVGLSLRNHPVALLRPQLDRMRVSSAAQVRAARPGQIVRVAGMVTCRQHPPTAKGTTFVTLEDETGFVNVVVWARVGERHRKELVLSRLMLVAGHVERQGKVVHLMAGKLIDRSGLLERLNFSSRDFH